MAITNNVNSQTLLVENFNYASGSALTANGWTAHSGAGNNPVLISSSGLIFSGYPSSNIGLAASLNNDGEDVNKVFKQILTGNVYCAFMFKAGSVTSDYFLHLSNSGISSNRARVYIKGTGSSFNFGLSKGAETETYTTGSVYSTGTTYLLVLKYTVVEGVSNDVVSLYIFNGSIPATEPSTSSIGPIGDASQSDLSNVSAVALRQYSASQNILIDGIRVSKKWEDAISVTTSDERLLINKLPSLYPNPSGNYLTVGNLSDTELIEILDLSGKVRLRINTCSSGKEILDLSSLISGIYFVRFSSSTGVKTMKLIKL